MTRKSRGFRQLEALESKTLLTLVPAVPTVLLPLATAVSVTPTGSAVSLPLATVASTTPMPGGVYGTVSGSYGHLGSSLPINAQGNASLLGHVKVKGSITLSGPKSDMLVNGLLSLTEKHGTVQLQVEANHAAMTPQGLVVNTTETVVGSTGFDAAYQGETGSGTLELGQGTRTIHEAQGVSIPAQKFFSLSFTLNPPTT